MEKIKLEIAGLSYSQTQSGAYALVLAETKGKRRLPIIIGAFEAQSIFILQAIVAFSACILMISQLQNQKPKSDTSTRQMLKNSMKQICMK